MFKNIYVDRKTNSFKLWTTDGEERQYNFKCRSWKESPGTLNTPYKTIYGVPVVPVFTDSYQETLDKKSGRMRHEIDIQPEIRILSEFYENQEVLNFKIEEYNILSLDIEVENGSGFPEPSETPRRINLISCYSTFYKKFMIWGLHEIDSERFHTVLLEKQAIYREKFPNINIIDNYEYVYCYNDEEKLLNEFFTYVDLVRPDIYTGWNCVAKNSKLWLNDRIIEIGNVSNEDVTSSDGKVIKFANTGTKEAFEITTQNGYKITSSSEHIFPIKRVGKNKHINTKSPSIVTEDLKVSDIVNKLESDKVYLRVDVRENKNRGYTYRDLVNHILTTKCNDKFDIVITENIYNKNRKKLNETNSESYSYNKIKQYPFRYSINNCRKLVEISDEELLSDISSMSEITILRNKSNMLLKLDEVISDDIFKMLGLIYTDGSYSNKEESVIFYNKDKQILDWFVSFVNKNNISETKTISNGNKCGRIRIQNSAYINMLRSLIYLNNKKNLDLTNLSRISYSQFCGLFSGLVDGDGWVSSSIGFCNYNNDDINKVADLLQWNGVLCGFLNKNSIRIHTKTINDKFISDLSCVGIKNDKCKHIIHRNNEDSKSKFKNYMFFDGHYYVRIKSIKQVDSVEMFDIETESHYFNTNYGIKTHNCNKFDLPYIINRAKKLMLYSYQWLSPVRKVYLSEKFNDQFMKMELVPVICGVSCIDYIELYKKFNLSQKADYKLDSIASAELGLGKVKLGDSGLSLAEKDWTMFSLYNLVDTVLVVLFEPKLKMIESLIGTCAEARIPLEYFFTSKRVILGFMMTYMHKKGLVIPFTKDTPKEAYEGAYIKINPKPYRWVASYDAKAMYPSIMISCNISPETKVVSSEVPDFDCSRSVLKNVYYRNEYQGIVPEIVAEIVDGRDEFKKLQKKYSNPESPEYDKEKAEYYKRKQNAYKIFANSVYGLLGNNHFQFYDVHNAATITGIGNKLIQHVITYAIAWLDNKLPTDMNFYNEFGEYANVTIKGTLDDSYIKSFDESDRPSLGKFKRLVLAHTDSFFFDYSDMYEPFEGRKRTYEEYLAVKDRFSNKESKDYNKGLESYFADMNDRNWDEMSFTEFMLRFNHCVFDKVMGLITKKWSTTHNYREDRMWFKLEKCCNNLVALSKAHYICYLQYDEGDLLMHQPFEKRLKAVGVEMIKSDTPVWSKKNIMKVLELLFSNISKNEVAKHVGMLKKDYRSPENTAIISRPASINTLKATLANTFPAPRMGSIIWNRILEEDKDFANYEPITEGTKIKWIAVKQPNKYNIGAISYNSEKYPPELSKYFTVDYDTQMEKTFRKPLEKILECYGWGNIFDGNVDSIRRFFTKKAPILDEKIKEDVAWMD